METKFEAVIFPSASQRCWRWDYA